MFDTPALCRTCCTAAIQVLEQNYRFKMQYSPDYQGIDIEKAGGGLAAGTGVVATSHTLSPMQLTLRYRTEAT